MSDLPDNIKRFDILKVEYAKKKLCECYGTPHYTIDSVNRLIYCDKCGGIVDSFEALKKIANNYAEFAEQSEYLLKQRKEIVNWKPWLIVFRDLESRYRSKEMLPCCPECRKPFYFEKIKAWYNRKLHEKQVERERKGIEK
jgi:hypothetical protein